MDIQAKDAIKENSVFALDIGTRSVIGVVGYSENDIFHIEAIECMEHPKRAMLDGQIEDINAVAAVANIVKMALEERIGRNLTKVCVAAAGRALRTVNTSFEVELPAGGPVTEETVYALEMGAVSKAADEIRAQAPGDSLFCVGHSVARFLVDDYVYSTIIDHKGKTAKAEIIATFLPAEVVNSLEATMKKIGLTIDFLTLEPIAAMNAVIPPELRLLNLALVDIGAGTSDIAVCDGGTVAAYTMATVAGDEITEALIKQYLVDFKTAEKMKFAISESTPIIAYQDILGFDYEATLEEVLGALRPALTLLADTISDKLLEVNSKTPSAVFLVGGGGKTPLLCELIAQRLSLDEHKVAIGGNNFMKRLATGAQDAFGPEYATPIGIALTALSQGQYKGFDVFVNGEKRRLLRTGTLAMMDVLLLCGYSYSDVMGKSGKSLNFEVNGEKRILRGGLLKPAALVLNGEPVGISVQVNSGDSIHILPAGAGENASLTMGDILANYNKYMVDFCGRPTAVGQFIELDGKAQGSDSSVNNGDKLFTVNIVTLADLCLHQNADNNAVYEVNGIIASPALLLHEDDIISLRNDIHLPKESEAQALTSESSYNEASLISPKLIIPEDTRPVYAAENAQQAFSQSQTDTLALHSPSQPQADTLAPHSPSQSQADTLAPQNSTIIDSEGFSVNGGGQSTSAFTHESMPVPALPKEEDLDSEMLQNTNFALPPDIAKLLGIALPNDNLQIDTAENASSDPQPFSDDAVHGANASNSSSVAHPTENHMVDALHDSSVAHHAENYTVDVLHDSSVAHPTENHMVDALHDSSVVAGGSEENPLISGWTPPEPMFSPEPLLAQESDFKPIPITLNGRQAVLPARVDGVPYLFLDMLTLVDIDPSKPQGDIELTLNGHDASFLEKICAGDNIRIAWKRR